MSTERLDLNAGAARPPIPLGNGTAEVGGAPTAAEVARLKRATAGFEAQFLTMLLKSMRKTVPESGFLGRETLARSTWEEFMDQALTDAASRGGGLGLGALVEQSLERSATAANGQRDAAGFIPLAAAQRQAMPLAGEWGGMPLAAAERALIQLERTAGAGGVTQSAAPPRVVPSIRAMPSGPSGFLARTAQLAPTLAGVGSPSGVLGQLAQQLATTGSAGAADPQQLASRSGITRSLLERLGHYDDGIQDAARQTGLRPNLLRAVAVAESGLEPLARSHRGALGIMQLMPATAQELGVQNPFDAGENIRAGARYLSQLMDRFDGDTQLALAGYNAGPGVVARYGTVPPYGETRRYIARVTELLGKLERIFPGQ